MLLEGTDELTLNRAVGHIEGTALPGQPGNVGIAGHRDGFFRGLEHLESGDALSVTTLEGVAHYEVAELEVVEPTAVEVLDPTAYDSLTLVTCYPFYYVGDAPQRFIVHAKQVRFNPWK
jgi:sortase A